MQEETALRRALPTGTGAHPHNYLPQILRRYTKKKARNTETLRVCFKCLYPRPDVAQCRVQSIMLQEALPCPGIAPSCSTLKAANSARVVNPAFTRVFPKWRNAVQLLIFKGFRLFRLGRMRSLTVLFPLFPHAFFPVWVKVWVSMKNIRILC